MSSRANPSDGFHRRFAREMRKHARVGAPAEQTRHRYLKGRDSGLSNGQVSVLGIGRRRGTWARNKHSHKILAEKTRRSATLTP